MTKFGFIGTGNMAGALAIALAKNVAGDNICLFDVDTVKVNVLAEKLHANVNGNTEIADTVDYMFLGVKPQMLDVVASQLAENIKARAGKVVLISMLAGTQLEQLEKRFGKDAKIIRIMPNTPVAVSRGIILYKPNPNVTPEEVNVFTEAMKAAGRIYPIEEDKMEAATSVTGCGPAFVDMFIEALADAAVSIGIPRADAISYAAAMVAGSAELVLASGKHPEVLKDEVCSPAGTTIQGVRTLEQKGFRSAVFEAVLATYEKNSKL